MPYKTKNRKASEHSLALGRESNKIVRNDHIKGNYT